MDLAPLLYATRDLTQTELFELFVGIYNFNAVLLNKCAASEFSYEHID